MPDCPIAFPALPQVEMHPALQQGFQAHGDRPPSTARPMLPMSLDGVCIFGGASFALSCQLILAVHTDSLPRTLLILLTGIIRLCSDVPARTSGPYVLPSTHAGNPWLFLCMNTWNKPGHPYCQSMSKQPRLTPYLTDSHKRTTFSAGNAEPVQTGYCAPSAWIGPQR